jgi:hypothetical protein
MTAPTRGLRGRSGVHLRGRSGAIVALALLVSSCAPMLEGSAGSVAAVEPSAERLSGGWRSTLAVGVARPNGGLFGRAEAVVTHNTDVGTMWSWRGHVGHAFPAALERPGSSVLEVGGDVGSRFRDGQAFQGFEFGARFAWVFPILDPDRLPDQNEAFIFLGRAIDLVLWYRAGGAVQDSAFGLDTSGGLAVRVRAWTDLL